MTVAQTRSMPRRGIPGMRGIEHIGLTVPDMDAACDFFENVLGCEVLFSGGAVQHDASDWMLEHLAVHPRSRLVEYRYVRCGNGSNMELFQYDAPEQACMVPRNSDIGGHHLAFYVDDMTTAINYLKSHGVTVLGEPTKPTSGPTEGLTWCYFLAPWGLQLELVSCENGIAHDANSQGRTLLWHPKYPAERLIQPDSKPDPT